MTKKKIGIFGGTFDPMHEGHRRIAKALQAHCHLDSVQFIPCGQPVHRDVPMAIAEDRLTMLKLALDDEPLFTINTCELDRPGPSYMIDTLLSIKGENPTATLYLILGADAFVHFTSWREWERILTLANLIVVNRDGISEKCHPEQGVAESNGSRASYQKKDPLDSHKALAQDEVLAKTHRIPCPNDLQSVASGLIYFYESANENISATNIRHCFKEHRGEQVKKDLATTVYDYITRRHLYDNP